MMNDIQRLYIRRILQMLLGLAVSAVGIQMMIQANIGVDPWSTLNLGLVHTFTITYGLATALSGFAILVAALLLGEQFGLGTLGNVFILGLMIDAVAVTDLIPLMQSLFGGLLMIICGMLIASFGTWLYMSTGLGSGPRDALMVTLNRRIPLPIGPCRIIIEILVTVVGWLLGGPVGIGTLVSMFGFGLCVQMYFHLFHFEADTVHQETVLESWHHFMRNDGSVDSSSL